MGGANSAGSLAEAGHFNLAEAFFARVSEALPDGYSLNLGDDPRNSMVCARGKGEICSPFLLNGDIATAAGKDWASEIEFLNPFCQPVRCEISWKELASFRGDPIGKLAGDGLRVHCREETEALISDYRKKTPGRLLTRLSGPGWSDDGLAFALQSGDLVSLEANSAYRAPASKRQAEIRGTFDEWRDGIGAMASQNPNMIFAISAGLSPAILRFLPSGSSTICHFFGPTSVGKTRLLRVGLSVWPREATAEQNWHSTVNGLEGVMQARNDHLCALDELPAVPETRLSDAIYMIGNGVGKERANAEGKSGERHTWRTVVLSSGESTIWSSLRNSGSVVKGGLSVRAIDIPVEGRYGAFDCLHGHKDIKAFLDRLDSCVSATSGTAAEAFITALMVRGGAVA
ncbi:DUF927 domain-containing protein [Pseudogemmobacter faecipullorum]|uniref:DUF927 domain-containing protein n=1 Tax=Pseudogemmobacter faecipullorum TaxID=2755041 RepID=A0ABS8CSF6_9RHOB|nr:DUF927 domain-containing protein [Pseudogemmobacter faecipullorum]MCB5412289.1 DUF927 domain-containing protein [Pseudogemmobacter faecipullorum]